MFRDEREAALARAAAAERRAAELELKLREGQAERAELEATLAERDAELAKLRPIANGAEDRKAKARAHKQREREERTERARRERAGRPSWLREHKGTVGTVAGIALLMAGIGFGIHACNQHRAMEGPGSLRSITVVKLADGKQALLFVSTVDQGDSPDDHRLDLVDPGSGTRLKRVVLEKHERGASVIGATPGRIWMVIREDKQLELRALPGLDPVARWEDLVRATPALAAGVHGQVEVDGASGKLQLTTRTGEQLLIDSVSLRARPFVPRRETLSVDHSLGGGHVLLESVSKLELIKSAGTLYQTPHDLQMESGASSRMSPEQVTAWRAFPRLQRPGASDSATTGGVEISGTRFFFAGSPRATLQVRRPPAREEPVAGSPELIEPAFIPTRSETALLPEDAGFLVRHQETLESPTRLLISRMTSDGKLRFTTVAPGRSLKLAHLAGEVVALVIERSGGSYLLGLGWRDGRERWRYPL